MLSPKAPDPYQTANAQFGADKDAAITSSLINNINEKTPFGSVKYDTGTSRTYIDSQGKKVTVPTQTRTIDLSPAQKKILGQQEHANLNLGRVGNAEIVRLSGALAKPMVTADSLPEAGKPIVAPTLDQSKITATPMQTEIADAGAITKTYGANDYSADRKRVEDAYLARSNEDFARDESAMDQKLRNQGLVPGSEAYNTQFDQLRRQQTDARNQAIVFGGQEQSRLSDLERQRAQFENEAQGQQFGQNQAKGLFANTGNQANFDNSLTSQGAQNTAKSAQYRLSSSAEDAKTANRQRSLEEALALRQAPINEALALASGTQLTTPQFAAPYQQSVNGAPIAELIGQDYQNKLNRSNGLASGLFGLLGNLGAAGITASDRRLKTEIRRLGTLFDQVNLYRWIWRHDGKPSIGVLADEVAKVLPGAVHRIGGMLMVDYREVMAHAD